MLLLAVVFAVSVSACGGPTLIPITGYQVDGPDVKLAFEASDCPESYTAVVIAETDQDVTLEVRQTGDGEACPGGDGQEFAVVDLSAVLDNREVIDGSTGNPVPTSR